MTVEATLEHPFFVYNQGWSSYCPERTLVRYGLHCRQLMVGNSCISLTHRDPRLQMPVPHASTARVNPTKPEPGEILPRSNTTGGPNYEPCRKMARRESVVKAYYAPPADPASLSSTAWPQCPPKDVDQCSGRSSQSVTALTARSTPAMPAAPVSDVSIADEPNGQSPAKCNKRRRWSASDVKTGCEEEGEENSITEKGPVSAKARPVVVAITTKGGSVDEAIGVPGQQVKTASNAIDG